MKLTVRRTYAFVEITVDEIETTVFDIWEIDQMIDNLTDIIEELKNLRQQKIIKSVADGTTK